MLASAVALAADFAALKGSVETMSIAGSWRGQVTMDLGDAHAVGRRAGAPRNFVARSPSATSLRFASVSGSSTAPGRFNVLNL